jgi:hypothetical protein
MAPEADLLPGTLDLLILKAVSLGSHHGYGVLLRIGQITDGALAIEYSHDSDAVGRLLRLGGPTAPAVQVVGVVGAIQQLSTFGNLGPVAALPGEYVPATQFGDAGFVLVHNCSLLRRRPFFRRCERSE